MAMKHEENEIPIYSKLDDVYCDGSQLEEASFVSRFLTLNLNKYLMIMFRISMLVLQNLGRVNLIGEHIDYEGYSVGPDQELDLKNHQWGHYFIYGYKGFHEYAKSAGLDVGSLVGLDVMIDGTVPTGFGLSNSAAFVCSSTIAIMASLNVNLPKKELAQLTCVCERHIGTQSGGMDETDEEPVKYMGCGDCDNFSHSLTVPMATNDVDVLQRISKQLFSHFHIDVEDVRGIGLQVTKLESEDNYKQDADIHHLLELSEEFSLVPYPEQVSLERLFRVDDIRVGATSRKAIPALVDLLKPIPDRPGAPFLALGILIQLGNDCPSNKIVMVEAGALEALTKYLSLGPQEATEKAATDLLGLLFSTAEICRHEASFGAVSQLIAVLRMGGRNARYSAAKALENLFCADHIRNADSARHAVQPLVEVLNTGFEKEQHAAIAALVRLLSDNPSGALAVADVEMNAVDVLCRILSSNCSMDLKGDAAELCCVLFGNTRIRLKIMICMDYDLYGL